MYDFSNSSIGSTMTIFLCCQPWISKHNVLQEKFEKDKATYEATHPLDPNSKGEKVESDEKPKKVSKAKSSKTVSAFLFSPKLC
jgi:hypothetical protein